jgi:hypothetical protein
LNLERSISNLSKRLDKIVESKEGLKEDDIEIAIETRFAKLREARAKKTASAVGLTYEDVYDTITQEELDWWLRQKLKVSPEDRYQDKKKHWYLHESSWYVRVPHNGYDGKGCDSSHGGCIPECRFYPKTGRIENLEVIQKHRELEERYRKNNAS